jgi:hypothetical protein
MQLDKDLLIRKIIDRAELTGFHLVTESNPADSVFQKGSVIMIANYAVIAVCFADKQDDSVINVWKENEFGMNRVLLTSEDNGLLIDGYMIIVLKETPCEEDLKAIREIETDTSVCRKHVVWPIGTDELKWESRLKYVTVLSLPIEVDIAKGEHDNFNLPPIAQEILDLYAKKGSYKAVQDILEKKANEN